MPLLLFQQPRSLIVRGTQSAVGSMLSMVHGSMAMKQRVLWDRVVRLQPLSH